MLLLLTGKGVDCLKRESEGVRGCLEGDGGRHGEGERVGSEGGDTLLLTSLNVCWSSLSGLVSFVLQILVRHSHLVFHANKKTKLSEPPNVYTWSSLPHNNIMLMACKRTESGFCVHGNLFNGGNFNVSTAAAGQGRLAGSLGMLPIWHLTSDLIPLGVCSCVVLWVCKWIMCTLSVYTSAS